MPDVEYVPRDRVLHVGHLVRVTDVSEERVWREAAGALA
jgi:hypothetical protein